MLEKLFYVVKQVIMLKRLIIKVYVLNSKKKTVLYNKLRNKVIIH